MDQFESNNQELIQLVEQWTHKLLSYKKNTIEGIRNSQNRNIKQIVGHMVDSASNNTHRMIHLQYQQSPLEFPNYATHGNNDRWIAIQNYENEDWENLVQLWKYAHLHFVHVVRNIDHSKLSNLWNAGDDNLFSLKDMVLDFLRHFKLHISEIEENASKA